MTHVTEEQYEPGMSVAHLRASRRPVRMVFWGGLLYVVLMLAGMLGLLGHGIGLAVAASIIGVILGAAGMYLLMRIPVSGRYLWAMRCALAGVVTSVAGMLVAYLARDNSRTLFVASTFSLLAQVAGTVAFCTAMRWFAIKARLYSVSERWRTSRNMLAAGLIGPVAGALIGLPAFVFKPLGVIASTPVVTLLGVVVIPMWIVLLFGALSLFVALARTCREAAHPPDAPRDVALPDDGPLASSDGRTDTG